MHVTRKPWSFLLALSLLGLAAPLSPALAGAVTIHCIPPSLDPDPLTIFQGDVVVFTAESTCGSWLISIPKLGSWTGTVPPGGSVTTPPFAVTGDYPYTATGTTVLSGLIKVIPSGVGPVMGRKGMIALVALLGLAGLWFLRRR
ncbi:MAG: hypothetical protein U1E76_03290 [Planctomycetota bacterium]